MSGNPNRSIYNERYVPAQLEVAPTTRYDAYMLELRRGLLRTYCAGKDALDLCCGSGAFLVEAACHAKSVVGLDFSRRMLEAAATKMDAPTSSHVTGLVEADARYLPFADRSFDTVFSFTSLYYVPNVQRAIMEAARVLRPGGVAVLELGNSRSLAILTGAVSHRFYNWAKLYGISYGAMRDAITKAGLEIEQYQAFQILPLFGPRPVQLLLPFSASIFKRVLGLTVRGRLLDSMISGTPLLRPFAYRHLFVLKKPSHG